MTAAESRRPGALGCVRGILLAKTPAAAVVVVVAVVVDPAVPAVVLPAALLVGAAVRAGLLGSNN
jgi:hypothetical protein